MGSTPYHRSFRDRSRKYTVSAGHKHGTATNAARSRSGGFVLFLAVVAVGYVQGAEVPKKPSTQTMTFQGREIPRSDAAILDPKHTVLVIHEMLNDFVSKGGVADQAGLRYAMDPEIDRIGKLLAAARKKNARVAYVRWTRYEDGATDDDASCAVGSRVCSGRRTAAGRTRPPSNIEGSWGWQAPEAIAPAPGDWVLPKWRQDAFFSTQLDALMRWNGIKTMVIVGLGTEVGIMPSVMTASELGYFTVVVEDAIKAVDPARREPAMAFLSDTALVRNTRWLEEIWSEAAAAPAGFGRPSGNTESGADCIGGRTPVGFCRSLLDPKRTLLLVHDMQHDVVGKGGASDDFGGRVDASGILKPVQRLLAGAREKNMRVAYTKWTNYADGSSSPRHVPQAGGALIPPPRGEAENGTSRCGGARATKVKIDETGRWAIEGTSGWEVAQAVKPNPGDWEIRQYRPDAFFATPLDSLMRWNGIKTLVVVGIGVQAGVVQTLMSAANLGYFTVAVSDGVLPSDPGQFEEAGALIQTHSELLDIWRGAAPKPAE